MLGQEGGSRSCGVLRSEGWASLDPNEFRNTIIAEIIPSARKHGVGDADIRHAVRNAIALSYQGEERTLWIGPACNGALLEVITVQMKRGESIAIHAMSLHRSYERLLTGSG